MLSQAFIVFLVLGLVYSIGEIEDVNDFDKDDLHELAQFATSKIYENSTNGMMPTVEVIKASKQVVSGINFFLTLKIKFPDSTVHTCHAIVYVQPWEGTRELLKSDCPHQLSVPEFGGDDRNAHPVDPDDPVVQRVAKYAVEKINELSKCFVEARLESVDKALTTRNHYSLNMTICNWPFGFHSHDDRLRMPHPCALPENLHECNAVVLTQNGIPVSFEGYSCTGC